MARMASGVRRRNDGILEKRITINGKRYSIYAANTKELNDKEYDLRERIKSGSYTSNRNITLDAYYQEWIEHKKSTIKANTAIMYDSYYTQHIRPAIGKRKIRELERREILKLQRDLSKKLAPTTVNVVFKTLKAIMHDAIKDEIILHNPADIKELKTDQKATDTYHRALTEQEQKIFMQALKDNYYYSFIALMLTTGMRAGEVAALTWNDIDYKSGMIHVTKTITKDSSGKFVIGTTTKTDASKRDIPINDNIRYILKEHRAKSDILQFRTNNVFVTVYGNQIDNCTINRAIRSTLKSLDKTGVHIERFTSHAMRDTFATRYIEQGGNMQTLKTLLGHSSITLTMDLYAHVLPDTKQNEMQRISIAI